MSETPDNHYRTLYVHPDAPPEVIKAAWRALMSSRRVHPDLGGDHDEAVRLNTAYEVLGDPARRAAYDESLQLTGSLRGGPGFASAAAPEPAARPRASAAHGAPVRRCPFCGQTHTETVRRDTRCSRCDSPLAPLPERAPMGPHRDDSQGRRRDPRFARDAVVELRLPDEHEVRRARLLDLSFSGLQLQTADPVPRDAVVRVIAPWFDALFAVVNCRPLRGGCAVHGRLLTLLMQQQARGVYVSAKV